MPNNAASIELSFSRLIGMRPLHLALIVLNFVLFFAKLVPDSLFTSDAEDNRCPKRFYSLLTPYQSLSALYRPILLLHYLRPVYIGSG